MVVSESGATAKLAPSSIRGVSKCSGSIDLGASKIGRLDATCAMHEREHCDEHGRGDALWEANWLGHVDDSLGQAVSAMAQWARRAWPGEQRAGAGSQPAGHRASRRWWHDRIATGIHRARPTMPRGRDWRRCPIRIAIASLAKRPCGRGH